MTKHNGLNPPSEQLILSAKNLKKYYTADLGWFKEKKAVKALDGVSFDLHQGETLSIVGESGCGKSTLARMLTLIEYPTAGEVDFEGVDISKFRSSKDLKLIRQKIQFVFQNPYSSLNPRKTIGSTLEEALLLNTNLNKQQRKEKVLQIMSKVGLRSEAYDRYPHMFSGGQRQRIAIARGIMMNPKILVADEPVSALDVSIRAQVLNLMLDLQNELGLSYVFISHDLSVVRHISHRVAVMYLGKIIEFAPTETLFSQPRHPYTISLMHAAPTLERKTEAERKEYLIKGELPSPLNPPPGCAFHARCPKCTEICKTEVPPLKRYSGDALIACHNVDEPALN